MKFVGGNLTLSMSEDMRRLVSLKDGERELLSDAQKPLFTVGFRDENGAAAVYSADSASDISIVEGDNSAEIIYSGFGKDFRVRVSLNGGLNFVWNIEVENQTEYAVEYVDFPSITYVGELRKNGGDAAVLWPYNEGVLVEDSRLKRTLEEEPVFPSHGSYAMFPYMIFAQLILYLYGSKGIYMGMHDRNRAPKSIDFCCQNETTEFRTRLFMGGNYGETVGTAYKIVWSEFSGDWHDGANLYRQWFGKNLPNGLDFIKKREDLPQWYKADMPVVITYPVRGDHDTGDMAPNKLFPYKNALPVIEEIASKTESKMMVLLMHWEGSAPWAPPYVWPPYGGEEGFLKFMEELHKKGHLLGVYCSGLSFTQKSNLVADYDLTEMMKERKLESGFCLSPEQKIQLSRICPPQRSGYDICVASKTGHDIMNEALIPLLESGVDYIQALDQNHGGSMYFCYAKDHGHPPVPGKWMTEASNSLFEEWRNIGKHTLLGCESAAAEPFIASLSISDNRYEINYLYGNPVPLYAYLYHPYVHNFMGNQVSCALEHTTCALNLRIAYSFLAGDLITLVLNDEGEIMFNWGRPDHENKTDRESVIAFAAALQKLGKQYPWIFQDAEMTKPLEYTCSKKEFLLRYGPKSFCEKSVLSTAWEKTNNSGECVQLFVNYTDEEQICTVHIEKGDVIQLALKPRSVDSIVFIKK